VPNDKANTNLTPSDSANVENSPVVVSNDKQSSTGNKSKNSSASSQMQLLGLAKQFVLDGSLLAPEKQMPLEDRARKRERVINLRRQQNLEAIIQKTVGYCSNNEVTDRADQDWFNRFTVLAQDISNKTMQELWAKILAKEIAQPGSFSLKTLKAFRTMSISEAKLLAKACGLAVKDQHQKNVRIISGAYQKPGLLNFFDKNREKRINNATYGLSYAELMVLADNDLMFLQETESTALSKSSAINFNYNGIALALSAKKNDVVLSFYKFTPIGTELSALIGDKPDTEYVGELKKQLSYHFAISES